MSVVVPAVLPASQGDLEEKLARFAVIPAVSRIQIDVVDGRFASPATWPYFAPSSLEATKGRGKATKGTPYPELEDMVKRGETLPYLDRIEYEIDLMCFDALSAAENWLALGASRLVFHAGSTDDLPRLFAAARKRYGDIVSLGLALTVESDLALVGEVVKDIDFAQFMGIARIGRQGQPFDERVFECLRIFRERHPDIPLQVDGGVSLGNAQKLFALGVANVVVGSALLRASDPASVFAQFESLHNQLQA